MEGLRGVFEVLSMATRMDPVSMTRRTATYYVLGGMGVQATVAGLLLPCGLATADGLVTVGFVWLVAAVWMGRA